MLSRRLLRIKAVKALYAHFKSDSDSLISSEKNLMFSIDKTYELYWAARNTCRPNRSVIRTQNSSITA